MAQHDFKLVDSTYTPEEARNVLLSIIQDKIKSINRLCFSLEEREPCDLGHFRERIKQLTAMREEVKQVMAQAEDLGMNVEVDATISVTLRQPAEKV